MHDTALPRLTHRQRLSRTAQSWNTKNYLVLLLIIFSPAMTLPKFLLLGDSLTQTSFEGWGATLADRYQRRADILIRGCSGYNTRWYLLYADSHGIFEEQPAERITLVTIFFGANDAALKDLDAKHVPLTEYQENLKTLVQKAKSAYPKARILLIAPPPVHREQRLIFQKQRYGDKATGIPERTSEHTQLYAKACVQVAQELNLPCLDLFSGMMESSTDFGSYLSDGLHFNQNGHKFVGQELLQAIDQHFPELAVQPDPITGQSNNSGSSCKGLPSSGPYHEEINPEECARAFGKQNYS
ncbi:lysophospholipase L1-like esterase [Nitzschia inconspicua]|uniref:Lysophospholipase L1-like esterase n=1 Tax=Nitzschia inconspicua TaxID=303405 RepID=A0A9K3PCH5_9STRA|nr:lysophospholipase L1-like esterase [Nitzschia inconspicua]